MQRIAAIKSLKGFTLIELLIVISIIGILAVALLPSVLGAPARARDAARKADLNNIIAALELYNSDHQQYPIASGCIDALGLNSYFNGQNPPKDPQNKSPITGSCGGTGKYGYVYCPITGVAGYSYLVGSYMEVPGDANFSAAGNFSCPNNSVPTLAQASGDTYIILK